MNTGGGDRVQVTFFGRGDSRVGGRDLSAAVGGRDSSSAMLYLNGMFMHNSNGVINGAIARMKNRPMTVSID